MKTKYSVVITIVTAVSLILAMGSTCLAADAIKTIKIGVLYPLTGGAAAEGRELRAGAELALEIANG